MMLGANRPPSSLNQFTTARLNAARPALRNLGVQTPGRVQGGDDTVRAVEPATERLAVQMGSDQHIGRPRRPLEQREHVADPVHPEFPSGLTHPPGEPVACLRVLRGCGLAVDAVVGGGADGGHVVEVFEESC